MVTADAIETLSSANLGCDSMRASVNVSVIRGYSTMNTYVVGVDAGRVLCRELFLKCFDVFEGAVLHGALPLDVVSAGCILHKETMIDDNTRAWTWTWTWTWTRTPAGRSPSSCQRLCERSCSFCWCREAHGSRYSTAKNAAAGRQIADGASRPRRLCPHPVLFETRYVVDHTEANGSTANGGGHLT